MVEEGILACRRGTVMRKSSAPRIAAPENGRLLADNLTTLGHALETEDFISREAPLKADQQQQVKGEPTIKV